MEQEAIAAMHKASSLSISVASIIGRPGRSRRITRQQGCVNEGIASELITAAGFELAARSEIMRTRRHPNNCRVWTLPPDLARKLIVRVRRDRRERFASR